MKKFITILLFISVLFCSCGNIINNTDFTKNEAGTVTFNLAREEVSHRTINAEGENSFKNVDKWNVTFTPTGSEGLEVVEKSVSLDDFSYSFSLLPGTYDVTFKGSVTLDEDTDYPYTLYYSGNTAVTVEAGKNDSVTVYVGLQKEAGESSCLHYTIGLGNDISFSDSPKFKVLLENLSGGDDFEFEEANVVRKYVGSFSKSEFAFIPEAKQLEIFLDNVPSAFYRISIYYIDGDTTYKFVAPDDIVEISKGAWAFEPDAVSIGTLTSRIYYATEAASDFNGVAAAYPANLTSLLTKLSQSDDWHYAKIIMKKIPDMGSESIQNICAGINNTVDITVKTEDEIYRIKNGAITFNLDYALDETEDGGVVEVSGTWPMSSGVRTVRNVTIRAPEGKTLTLERGDSFVDKSMIEVLEGKTLTLENVVLDGRAVSVNTFGVSGGAVNVNVNGNLVMNNCVICNHRTGQNYGAALYVNTGADVKMNDTDMYNCVANNSPIYLRGTFTMNSGNIYGCGSGTKGGVFYITGGCLTMNGGLIGGEGTVQTISGELSRGNSGTYGGAVYISTDTAGSKFVMNGGTIAYNSVNYNGGGVYIGSSLSSTTSALMEFNGGTIAHNKLTGATSICSGIYVGGTLKLSDSAIIGEDNDVYIKPNDDITTVVVPYGQVETYRAANDGNENIVEVACNVAVLSDELAKIVAAGRNRNEADPAYIKILDTNPDLTTLNAAVKTYNSFTGSNGLVCVDLNMRLCTGMTTFVGTNENTTQTAFDDLSNLVGISLPSTVTEIGDYAFMHCSKLSRISIPSNVTSIGYQSFRYCSQLTSLDLLNVTSIGEYAFQQCYNLTSLNAPKISTIGGHAFEGCTELASLDLQNVTTVGSSAFTSSGVTTVTFSDKLVTLGSGAFDAANKLTSVEISGTTSISQYAFRNTELLETVIINSNSISFSAGAFSGSGVKEIVFNGNSLTIGADSAFENCSEGQIKLLAAKKSYLPDLSGNATLSAIITTYGATDSKESDTDIELTDGTYISEEGYELLRPYFDLNAVSYGVVSSNLSSLLSTLTENTADTPYTIKITDSEPTLKTIRDAIYGNSTAVYVDLDLSACTGITELTSSCFSGSSAPNTYSKCLVSIKLPPTLTTIGYASFWAVRGLKSVVIPASVTSISNGAFYQCSKLESVEFENITGWTITGTSDIVDVSEPAVNAANLRVNTSDWEEKGLTYSF